MKKRHQILAGVMGLCIIAPLAYLNLAPPISNLHPVPAAPITAAADHGDRASFDNRAESGTEPVASGAARLTKEITRRLHSNGPGDQEWVFTHLLPELVKIDPMAAARFAESNDIGGTHTEAMRVVAEAWANSNPEQASSWAAQLSDPDESDTVLGSICFQAARTDAQRAIRTLEAQSLDERRQTMLANLARLWADEDFPNALAWAADHPAGDLRDRLLLYIALSGSETDPADAARIVAERFESGANQNRAVIAVLDHWAEQDPDAATAWVHQFPPGDLKTHAEDELSRLASIPAASPFDKPLPIGNR